MHPPPALQTLTNHQQEPCSKRCRFDTTALEEHIHNKSSDYEQQSTHYLEIYKLNNSQFSTIFSSWHLLWWTQWSWILLCCPVVSKASKYCSSNGQYKPSIANSMTGWGGYAETCRWYIWGSVGIIIWDGQDAGLRPTRKREIYRDNCDGQLPSRGCRLGGFSKDGQQTYRPKWQFE